MRALIGIDPCPMAAAIVRATDQEAANASGAHLCKRDFLLAGELGHALLKRGRCGEANNQCLGEWRRHTTPISSRITLVEIPDSIGHNVSFNLRLHLLYAVDAALVKEVLRIAIAVPASQPLQIL